MIATEARSALANEAEVPKKSNGSNVDVHSSIVAAVDSLLHSVNLWINGSSNLI